MATYRFIVFACLAAPIVVCAQDFAALIRTPAGIQAALERCDGHPQFETALANWLESARPRSLAERDAIRETALRLLKDTTDSQVALGLINGLLRHALEDLKKNPAIVPEQLAQALHADILKAVSRHRSKAKEAAVLAYGLAEGMRDTRQAGFVKEFIHLAEAPAPRRVPAVKERTISAKTATAAGQ